MGDAWEAEDNDPGPLEDCPGCPDAVRLGWVWEPFAESGPAFIPYATWREHGHVMEMVYDEGASVQWS